VSHYRPQTDSLLILLKEEYWQEVKLEAIDKRITLFGAPELVKEMSGLKLTLFLSHQHKNGLLHKYNSKYLTLEPIP
jgi:hypothetical protein